MRPRTWARRGLTAREKRVDGPRRRFVSRGRVVEQLNGGFRRFSVVACKFFTREMLNPLNLSRVRGARDSGCGCISEGRSDEILFCQFGGVFRRGGYLFAFAVLLRKQEPRATRYSATLGSCFRRSTRGRRGLMSRNQPISAFTPSARLVVGWPISFDSALPSSNSAPLAVSTSQPASSSAKGAGTPAPVSAAA